MIRRIDIARAPTRERLVREVCNDVACVFLVPDFFSRTVSDEKLGEVWGRGYIPSNVFILWESQG